jgi:hypothetical protein
VLDRQPYRLGSAPSRAGPAACTTWRSSLTGPQTTRPTELHDDASLGRPPAGGAAAARPRDHPRHSLAQGGLPGAFNPVRPQRPGADRLRRPGSRQTARPAPRRRDRPLGLGAGGRRLARRFQAGIPGPAGAGRRAGVRALVRAAATATSGPRSTGSDRRLRRSVSRGAGRPARTGWPGPGRRPTGRPGR